MQKMVVKSVFIILKEVTVITQGDDVILLHQVFDSFICFGQKLLFFSNCFPSIIKEFLVNIHL